MKVLAYAFLALPALAQLAPTSFMELQGTGSSWPATAPASGPMMPPTEAIPDPMAQSKGSMDKHVGMTHPVAHSVLPQPPSTRPSEEAETPKKGLKAFLPFLFKDPAEKKKGSLVRALLGFGFQVLMRANIWEDVMQIVVKLFKSLVNGPKFSDYRNRGMTLMSKAPADSVKAPVAVVDKTNSKGATGSPSTGITINKSNSSNAVAESGQGSSPSAAEVPTPELPKAPEANPGASALIS